jgi:hypothetical protein
MPSILSIAASSLALVQLVSAHGYVSGIKVNQGAWIAGTNPNWYYQPAGTAPQAPGWQALNQDNGFVEPNSFTTTDIACHKSAKAGQTYISANPGDVLTLYWNTWPDTHKGPVINYLAKCSGMLFIYLFILMFSSMSTSLFLLIFFIFVWFRFVSQYY